MKKICVVFAAAAIAAPVVNFAQQSDEFDIAAAWRKDCTKCHAQNGSGLTKKGRKLRVRDYRKPEVQAEMNDADMAEAIREGIEDKGEQVMNPYQEDYSDQEIQAFIAFIRALSPE